MKKGGQPPSQLTKESSQQTILTLELDLNKKLEAANARRKEDAEKTKRELANIEEGVTQKLGGYQRG